MGIVARTYETSTFALDIHPFSDVHPRVILGPEDQPHVAPRFVPLLEKANAIVDATQAKAEAEFRSGFVNRTQSGMPPWAGPPGPPEIRAPITPEQAGGGILSWVA
ncbi:MAG: hypothetical protein D6E12_09430 [Desulfovibrio sp.]|mgnify:CR=1 FL=1|nr:MAG: hypothetical protein D6E12_09430 [Desulfovibrio sp.]